MGLARLAAALPAAMAVAALLPTPLLGAPTPASAPQRMFAITTGAAVSVLLSPLPHPAMGFISRRRRFILPSTRRPTRPPTRRPTRAPTRAPTRTPTGFFALRRDGRLYPRDLPSEVQVQTLPRFESVIVAEGGRAREEALLRVFSGFADFNRVRFSHRVVPRVLTNGTSIIDSFFFVDIARGSVLVFHPEAAVGSAFTVEILAVDDSGPAAAPVVAYNWTYSVAGVAALARSAVEFTFTLNGTEVSGADLPERIAIGATYRFNGPAANTTDADAANNRFFSNAQGSITFKLQQLNTTEPIPDGDMLINTVTGSLFVAPTAAYTAAFALEAEDESGRDPVEVLQWLFQALPADVDNDDNGPNGEGCANGVPVDAVPFDSVFTCDCTGTGHNGSNCEEANPLPQLEVTVVGQYVPEGETDVAFHNRTKWATGETYLIAPINVTNARIASDPAGTSRNVTFVLLWTDPDPPRKFFVDGASGEMLITATTNSRNLTALLLAASFNTVAATVATITFDMSPADTADPTNGPNGRDCQSASQRVDGTEFDGSFTCDCDGAPFLVGPNCDPDTSSASSSDSGGGFGSAGLAVTVAVVALLILTVGLIIRNRRLERWKARQPHSFAQLMEQLHNGGLTSARDTDVPAELKRSDVLLLDVLGKGNFGEVTAGKLSTTAGHDVKVTIDVAVKTLINDESEVASAEFLREAAVTWHFMHPNVVQMHGVVTSGEPYLLVLELCANGELKGYLESDEGDHGVWRLYGFMVDIARGMEHLASLHFVHRDLAVRNVLLDHDYVAKIADFGLGRDTDGAKYYSAGKASNLVLPLRWSDPVALETTKFSEYTDVWSYGITAIEIFTQGTKPYAGWTNVLVVEQLKTGYRLPRPDACPEALYDQAIFPCWLPSRGDPGRPSFAELVRRLTALRPAIQSLAGDQVYDGGQGRRMSNVLYQSSDSSDMYDSTSRQGYEYELPTPLAQNPGVVYDEPAAAAAPSGGKRVHKYDLASPSATRSDATIHGKAQAQAPEYAVLPPSPDNARKAVSSNYAHLAGPHTKGSGRAVPLKGAKTGNSSGRKQSPRAAADEYAGLDGTHARQSSNSTVPPAANKKKQQKKKAKEKCSPERTPGATDQKTKRAGGGEPAAAKKKGKKGAGPDAFAKAASAETNAQKTKKKTAAAKSPQDADDYAGLDGTHARQSNPAVATQVAGKSKAKKKKAVASKPNPVTDDYAGLDGTHARRVSGQSHAGSELELPAPPSGDKVRTISPGDPAEGYLETAGAASRSPSKSVKSPASESPANGDDDYDTYGKPVETSATESFSGFANGEDDYDMYGKPVAMSGTVLGI